MVNIVYKLMNERKSVFFWFLELPFWEKLIEGQFSDYFPIPSVYSQPVFTCSKSTMETAEQCEICSKLIIKAPELHQ